MDQRKSYWEIRAQHYEELEWANHKPYLEVLFRAGNFQPTDVVLDVGTGTGRIVKMVEPYVSSAIGLDKSEDMLARCDGVSPESNIHFVRGDIVKLNFREGMFDKLTARMVFHYILRDIQEATNECFRVLKKGGKMILAEGVPPNIDVKQDYIDIFKLKEERVVFMEEDLEKLLANAGFKNIKTHINIMPKMSVRNWLEKSGVEAKIQDKIFDMHILASDYFKRAYNMTIVDGDCLIDMKNAIIVGEK